MFFAPELFGSGDHVFGPKTDIWALGMSFYYILTGKYPYQDAKSLFHLRDLIMERDIDFSAIPDLDAR